MKNDMKIDYKKFDTKNIPDIQIRTIVKITILRKVPPN